MLIAFVILVAMYYGLIFDRRWARRCRTPAAPTHSRDPLSGRGVAW